MTLTGIPGGRAPERIGGVLVHREHDGEQSSPVDAVVLEEDRYLMLSAKPRLTDEKNHLRTLTKGFGAEQAELGTLVLRQGRPLTMLAVVVDVDADPPVEEGYVKRAFERVLAVCVAQRIDRVRVPLLGRLGRLPAARSAALLREVIAAHTGEFPRDVVVPLREGEEL